MEGRGYCKENGKRVSLYGDKRDCKEGVKYDPIPRYLVAQRQRRKEGGRTGDRLSQVKLFFDNQLGKLPLVSELQPLLSTS